MAGNIRIEREGGIATVFFDHPERRNAITTAMWREIPERARELDADRGVRVVVLRGAGDLAFVSGADISQFEEQRTGPAAQRYELENTAAFDALANIRKPVIAAIHGFCIGGGCAIALTAGHPILRAGRRLRDPGRSTRSRLQRSRPRYPDAGRRRPRRARDLLYGETLRRERSGRDGSGQSGPAEGGTRCLRPRRRPR